MAVKTKYSLKKYDLTKGQLTHRGTSRNQGMIPRRLAELRYDGDVLCSRPAITAYSGVYGASEDLSGDSLADGDYITGATVTNLCSDGCRLFGQVYVNEAVSESANPLAGDSGYLVELVTVGSAKVWKKTGIPAPMAATPLASLGPFSAASFNSGSDGSDSLLLTNWGPTSFDDSPLFHTLKASGSVGDPLILRKSSALTRFPNLAVTRAAGSGWAVAYDTVALAYRLLWTDGAKFASFLLKTTSAGSTAVSATGWDAKVIGSSLILYVAGKIGPATEDRFMYKYTLPVVAGNYSSTSANLSAATQSTTTVAMTADDVTVCLSSSDDSTTVYAVDWIDQSGGGAVTRRLFSFSTLAQSSALSLTAARRYARAVTCNNNLIIVESSSSSSEFSTSAGLYSTPLRNTATVSFFVVDSGVLVERPGFAATGSKSWGSLTASGTLDTNLNSHVSSGGLVCIGNSIYRCIQKQDLTAGTANVDVQFLCKVKDFDSNGSMHGDLTAVIGGRYANSLSRWVGERYVALAVGGGEIAFPMTDPGTAGVAPPDPMTISGLESNERTVVFDVYQTQLTACEVAPGVTSFGHGWSYSISGDETVSCSIERPIISAITPSARTKGINDWDNIGDIVTYRAVAVCSTGGYESFVASAPISYSIVSVEDDLVVTISINARCSAVSKIRLYRNVAPMAAADYQLIGEVDAPEGSTATVTITDNRIDMTSSIVAPFRPFDPTGGGVPLQGITPAGLRDIANVAGRTYVATSQYVIPCQEVAGDDQLPTPMVDILIRPASRLGAIKHIDSIGDTLVVSTENSIVGIIGDPPNALGQGQLQAAVVLSEGTGCNGKPCNTPAGLLVPRADGVSLVDRNRSVQEVFSVVSGDIAGDRRTLTGACCYSVSGDDALFKSTDGSWMVLDVKGGRWTEWSDDTAYAASAAACNRGPLDGYVAMSMETSGGGYYTSSPAGYAYPVVVLGWDSFPDRFTESKLSRFLIDGYGNNGNTVNVSLEMKYDLDAGPASASTVYTVPESSPGRDTQGFRVRLSPARTSGSSFQAWITFESSVKIEIETIVADVLEDTARGSAGNTEN